MTDYRVTEEEAIQWVRDYPYPHSGIVIKPFPKATDGPTYGLPGVYFLPPVNVPIEAPINLRLPLIYGRGEVGIYLRVTTGTWDNRPNLTYQWRRDGVPIDGQLDAIYYIVPSDIFHIIDVIVCGTNTAGQVCVASSNQVEVVVGPLIDPDPGGGPVDHWILITREWDDTGVWMDQAVVILWLLYSGNWEDNGAWVDEAIVVL